MKSQYKKQVYRFFYDRFAGQTRIKKPGLVHLPGFVARSLAFFPVRQPLISGPVHPCPSFGTPGPSRTGDLRIRSPTLYPAELQALLSEDKKMRLCEVMKPLHSHPLSFGPSYLHY
jgi:hypothetical protein